MTGTNYTDIGYEVDDLAKNIEEDDVDSREECFQYNIDAFTNSIPVERLVNDFNNNVIIVPKFQRPYVWAKRNYQTERHAPSLFIDSILRGLPIPPITIYKDANSREEGYLIDGQQRIKTLTWFITGKLDGNIKQFILRGEGVSSNWLGYSYETLEHKLKDFLLRAYIPVTFIRQLNDEIPPLPTASSLYVLFDRLNSGGQDLHPHEKRSVLTITNKSNQILNNFLETVYEDENWDIVLSFIDIEKKPESITQYRELIFRVYAFLLYFNEYKGNLAKFLDSFALNYNMTEEQSLYLIKITRYALYLINSLNKANMFMPRGRFNTSFYEVYMVTLLKKIMEGKNISENDLSKVYNKFEENLIYDPTGRSQRTAGILKTIYTDADNIFEENING